MEATGRRSGHEELRYAYIPNGWVRAGFLMFLLAAPIVFFLALGDEAPDMLRLSAWLSEPQVRMADIAFAAFCGFFAILGGHLLVVSTCWPKDLVLGETELVIPRYRRRTPLKIPYAEIQQLGEYSVHGNRMAAIRYSGGKTTLSAAMFENKDAFKSVCRIVRERAGI